MDYESSIVDDLYAGTLDDAVWNRGFLGIVDIVRASGATLLAFNPSTGAVLRDENYRLDSSVLDDYRRYWTYHDCRVELGLSIPVGCPMTERTLPLRSWGRTSILNEFLLPADLPHCMPVWLHKSDTKAVALSLQGARKRGPFDAHDMETLRRLAPHVSRALEIRDQLDAANVRAETLALCIDRAPFGVITLTSERKIRDVSTLAEHMLRRERSIRIAPDGTLVLPEPAGSQLSHWLANRSARKGPKESLIRIERGPGRPPVSILVNPAPQRPLRWVSGDPGCILFLFDPERKLQLQPALVATDLGISAREAELATLLADGLELAQVVQRLRISIHTARSHLKAIYAKTGIGSQVELVRRIATGAAALGSADARSDTQGTSQTQTTRVGDR